MNRNGAAGGGTVANRKQSMDMPGLQSGRSGMNNNIADLIAAAESDDDFALPALGSVPTTKAVVPPPAASQLSAHNSNNFASRARKDPQRASISDSDFDF